MTAARLEEVALCWQGVEAKKDLLEDWRRLKFFKSPNSQSPLLFVNVFPGNTILA